MIQTRAERHSERGHLGRRRPHDPHPRHVGQQLAHEIVLGNSPVDAVGLKM